MAVDSHISSLQERHNKLESQLQEMMASPSVSEVEINAIKRQKLQLKDRIRELTATR